MSLCARQSKIQHPTSKIHTAAGFTLIEILVALTILAVIVMIVYESFAAVTDGTASARVSADELRLRQFLERSFALNLPTACADLAYTNEQFLFLGTGGKSSNGMDSVEFTSSAPLMGGMAPPGFFKRVRYGIADTSKSKQTLKIDSTEEDNLASSTMTLEAGETLIATTADNGLENDVNKAVEAAASVFGGEGMSPTWSVPIEALRITYFDGQEWVDEWDSVAMGRMPWCVRIRVNFAKTKEQEANGESGDIEEDPDFDMYVTIPVGVGVMSDAATWLDSLAASGALPPGYVVTGTNGSDGSGTGNNSSSGSGTGAQSPTVRPSQAF